MTSDGKTYALIGTKNPETGTVSKDGNIVTYTYREVKANVTVNYVDENEKVIKNPVLDLDQASTGTAYDTTDKAEAEIVTSDGKTYALVGTEDPETGTVSKDGNTVTYSYREVKANVTVNYVDDNGEVIKDPVLDLDQASTGTAYDTTDKAEAEIVTSDGKTYALVGTEDSETGRVSKGGNTVTYTYREVKADVTVNYVDESGNEIKSPVTVKENVSTGTAYDTTDKAEAEIVTSDGKTYALVGTKDSETGTVSKDGNTVTYNYREVKADVIVNYVDESGNEIKSPVTVKENVSTGTAYDTTDKAETEIVAADGKTYSLVGTEDPEIGTVSKDDNTVTYTYREVTSDITVNFLDQDGNPIAPSQTPYDHVSTGLAYDTSDLATPVITTADGKTYRLVTLPNNAKGITSKEDVEVTYLYKEVKASVTVNYVDESGNEIKSPVTVKENVSTGTAYDTTDKAETEIVAADGKTYSLVGTEDPEIGTVSKDDNTVTYTYREVTSDITVNFLDQDGNPIAPSQTPYDHVSTGLAYDTSNSATPVITTADGKTYRLVTLPNNVKGITSKEDVEVTYVYEEVKESVTVNYVDENGKVIKDSVLDLDQVSTGTAYDTTDQRLSEIVTADGKIYKLDGVVSTEDSENPETGRVDADGVMVTYTYREVTSGITVNFLDQDGNPIAPSQIPYDHVSTGLAYDTSDLATPVIIAADGKTYRLVTVPNNAKGTTSKEDVEVTYVYEEVKASVTVNYVDESGNEIKSPITVKENVSTGTAYDTTDEADAEIVTTDGKTYQLDGVESTEDSEKPETGRVDADGVMVTYTYSEVKPDVTVNYVDESGNEVKSPVTVKENVSTGTAYGTTDKADPEIITADGKTYALVGTEDLETGTVSKDGNTVTYTYREVTSGITVNFLDQDGNPIASSQTPYDHVSTGLAYDTNNLATPVITTADGKTYRLVTVPDNAKGTTSKEDVEVTFIYEDVTPQISSLRINFVDESGKPLLFSNLTEVNVGDNYDTSNDRQERIVLSNGKVFELIEVQGSEEGNVSANGATVTYVYREVKANLTVNFVTTDGSTLRGTEVTDHSIGEQYDLSSIYPEVITIDGKEYRLIRVDGNQTGNIQEGDNIITYIYEEVAKEEPVVVTPENPTPAKQPVAPSEKTNELPQTGEKDSTLVTLAGLGMLVGGFSLLGKKRKEEE